MDHPIRHVGKREHEEGLGWFKAEHDRQRDHLIERVGVRLRAAMPLLELAQLPDQQPAGALR